MRRMNQCIIDLTLYLQHRRMSGLVLTLLIFLFCAPTIAREVGASVPTTLRVQLPWYHQAEFAGLYVAERQKYFAAQGLNILLVEGSPDTDPIDALAQGQVDVAISSFIGAISKSTESIQFTNIGQIFSGEPIVIICRHSSSILTPKDIVGKKFATANGGDTEIARKVIQSIAPGDQTTKFLRRKAQGESLIDRSADCITGAKYNEYWLLQSAGIPVEDLLIINPQDFGVYSFSDGIYVRHDRLASLEFQHQLSGFLLALERGWEDARIYPSLAIEATVSHNLRLDIAHQRLMLESVLGHVSQRNFGLLDISYLDRVYESLDPALRNPIIFDRSWTHAIWKSKEQKRSEIKMITKREIVSQSTKFYLNTIAQSPLFNFIVNTGVLIAGFAVTLLAIESGYGLWGRLVLSAVTCMGGGILRDILIGEARMPFTFIDNMTVPLGIIIIVLILSLTTSGKSEKLNSPSLQKIQYYANIIGMAFIAVNGAMITVIAGMSWPWVPFCAALSCAGGGTLRDIIMNREPGTFRGSLVEEIALVSGAALLAGLAISNLYEHSSLPVYLSITFALITSITLQLLRTRYLSQLPYWLIGKNMN